MKELLGLFGLVVSAIKSAVSNDNEKPVQPAKAPPPDAQAAIDRDVDQAVREKFHKE